MEDNKVRILRMLKNGLITVEEAKELLEETSVKSKSNIKGKVSRFGGKAKNIFEDTKPKAKGITINALEKISELSSMASRKLKEEYREADDDKKFFVAREIKNEIIEVVDVEDNIEE